MSAKTERRNKIKFRVRNKISGTTERPRMSVFRSNKQIYVQIIDDLNGKTLAAASSLGMGAVLIVAFENRGYEGFVGTVDVGRSMVFDATTRVKAAF